MICTEICNGKGVASMRFRYGPEVIPSSRWAEYGMCTGTMNAYRSSKLKRQVKRPFEERGADGTMRLKGCYKQRERERKSA